MATTVIKADRQALKREVLAQSASNARLERNDIERELPDLYARTTKHWGDSGVNKFPKPNPAISVRVVPQGDKGHKIVIDVTVDNPLWNWLDKGTPDIVQPKTSPPIPERVDTRTKVDDIDSNPFPGFTGRYFVIHAGRLRRGIPARRWHRAIARIVIRKDRKDFKLKNATANGQDVT